MFAEGAARILTQSFHLLPRLRMRVVKFHRIFARGDSGLLILRKVFRGWVMSIRYSINRLGFALGTVVCAVSAGSAGAAAEFSVNNRTAVLHNSVSGPGAASSFFRPGAHVFHESDIFHRTVLAESWNSMLSSSIRYTDTVQFDPDRFSLQKFEWQLSDATRSITLGDHFANLSQYSMSKAIKGMGYQQQFANEQNYVRAAYGSFDGQWAYLLKSNPPLTEPMDRHGGGVRYQDNLGAWTYGLNLSTMSDRSSDINRRPGESAFSQYIPAVDWEYRDSGLVVNAEHAYSNTSEETAAGILNTSGSAHKLALRTQAGGVNIDSNLERVSSDFKTLAGGATPDRLRGYLKADTRIDKLWRVFGVVDYNHNDLSGRTFRTSNTTYEVGATKKRVFNRKSMTLSGSYRQKVTDVSNGVGNRVSDRIKIKYNDRFAESIDFRAEVEAVFDRNKSLTPPAGKTKTADYLYSFGLTGRYETAKWLFLPNFEYGLQERENVVNGTDVTNTFRLGVQADRGDGTMAGMSYDYNAANVVLFGGDSRINRLNFYWENKPAWLPKGTVRYEFVDNNYTFENSVQDYHEQVLKMTLNWNIDN